MMSPYYKGLLRALYLTFRAMMSPYIPADLIFDHPGRKTLEESRSCVVVRIAAVKQTWKKVDFISNFQQNIYFYSYFSFFCLHVESHR